MSLPLVVWSEREPGAWHDCVFSAVLMALVGAGFDHFPAGAYADAEREALERSQNLFAPETGANFPAADMAVRNRYNVVLQSVSYGSPITLRSWLTSPGKVMALIGVNARLRSDLRAWDPRFAGAHCVAVRTGPTPHWLDPEAPMGYPGIDVDVDTILRWADPTGSLRYLSIGALGAVHLDYQVEVGPGTYALYDIPGGTLLPRARRLVTFSRPSHAPALKGARGFWRIAAGSLSGWYLIAGRSLLSFTATEHLREPGGEISTRSVPLN